MGRKSRRNDTNDVAVLNKPLEIFPTAIYARLSVENSGKDDGGAALATQIEICKQYIDERPYLQLVKVYQDNGFTGTSRLWSFVTLADTAGIISRPGHIWKGYSRSMI